MKSYVLTIALAMLVSAMYAFQNPGEVTVNFLFYQKALPLGILDVLFFSAGAVVMWVASLFAIFESSGKYKRQLKEKDKKIEDLEEEKKTILAAVSQNTGTQRTFHVKSDDEGLDEDTKEF